MKRREELRMDSDYRREERFEQKDAKVAKGEE
jgi:hypothetical protein